MRQYAMVYPCKHCGKAEGMHQTTEHGQKCPLGKPSEFKGFHPTNHYEPNLAVPIKQWIL
ncbi:gp054 [Erwinia phage vB_EamP-S6]|uniref:Gp054 n=1 Tax=Erwinia phage vB_EamP-S6 TaxID=1051675 RepID=G0YQE6_9CAUD|nr:gp054 [Erwinia phage vB_EamP-S6]AEJ81573.1 gp054 [Erwinia phage vB_EamP-S6]